MSRLQTSRSKLNSTGGWHWLVWALDSHVCTCMYALPGHHVAGTQYSWHVYFCCPSMYCNVTKSACCLLGLVWEREDI